MAFDFSDLMIYKIEMYDGKMNITCKDGTVISGKCIGDCQGTDASGEDADGVLIEKEDGTLVTLIEDDIGSVDFM